jgi:glycine/sarcosine N-methyltransferase
MEARDFYDGLGDDYDRMVSWEGRLAREGGFFRHVFDEAGARRVLDAACGTGMHAISFAREGVKCAGADVSPVMIARARENARAAGVEADFRVAGFGGMAAVFDGPFDAVTCLGNSLPHCADAAALRACLGDFASLLRPGGILVIQNRNYDRLLRDRQRFMPLAARGDAEGQTLYLRITDFPPLGAADEESLTFTLVTLRQRGGARQGTADQTARPGGGAWSQEVNSTPLRALRRAPLERALGEAGFPTVKVFGGYDGRPFDDSAAPDLVAVAVRGASRVSAAGSS